MGRKIDFKKRFASGKWKTVIIGPNGGIFSRNDPYGDNEEHYLEIKVKKNTNIQIYVED